jgi:hypothetical protein
MGTHVVALVAAHRCGSPRPRSNSPSAKARFTASRSRSSSPGRARSGNRSSRETRFADSPAKKATEARVTPLRVRYSLTGVDG